ncbi:galactoside alpha-(1,2)-fucosyltransferase 2-like [Macrobrachium nipponense]|uniref:galactoside alpha-(1,2)-fucosyltransferase 2-like n=1 Tax=Macrobrachium nipponense TaxID=159736 RepID=UPI0030C7DB97
MVLVFWTAGQLWMALEDTMETSRYERVEPSNDFTNTESAASESGLHRIAMSPNIQREYLDYDTVFANTSTIVFPIVVFSTVGRLGNCLCSYATALTFAGRFNATVAVTEEIFRKVSKVLSPLHLTLPVIANSLITDAYEMGVLVNVSPDYLNDDMVSHLLPTIKKAVHQYELTHDELLYVLEGYPNRMKMLADYHSKIRQNFQILEHLRKKASLFLQSVRASRGSDVTFIGFHIRRGDYPEFSKARTGNCVQFILIILFKVWSPYRFMDLISSCIIASFKNNILQKFFHCKVPETLFYVEALNYYRSVIANPVFVVCTDDRVYAEQHFNETKDIILSEFEQPEEDLALLAECSHSIMTVGSFGFWGSYLAGGEVVYPLVSNCSKIPFIHPTTLGELGFRNWVALGT